MYIIACLITAVSLCLAIVFATMCICAELDGDGEIILPLILMTLLCAGICTFGVIIVNAGETLTKIREVPIVLIERVDGTTYVYSKKGIAKDTSATIYICETNKLALIETYRITEKSKEEFKDTTLSIKVKE